ncbi:hypothetical protein SAMN04487958_11486 [Vreelandella subterranea]|uniref:Uncharacterized protein n=1 Tax=Vreelandella subterranea TaxID=416874 RepID=A0A1H9WFJ9_9GAMM|nr:hypothetical protein [Halomonas subterranea]SES32680.1 hypothetical protein SAMN04487958_11486 [Halomonas subterranea]
MTLTKKIKSDLAAFLKKLKTFAKFHHLTLRPLSMGALLALFLTPLHQFHESFCNALNSLFSPNLMFFTATLAAIFHSSTIISEKFSILSALFYEAAIQLMCIFLSGMVITLIILNFIDKGILWKDLSTLLTFMAIFFSLAFITFTTLPFFILNKNPISKDHFLIKIRHPGFILSLVIFLSFTTFYYITPEGLPEHNFCAT